MQDVAKTRKRRRRSLAFTRSKREPDQRTQSRVVQALLVLPCFYVGAGVIFTFRLPADLRYQNLINPLQLRRVKRLVFNRRSPAILNREARGFQPRRNFLFPVRIRRWPHRLPLPPAPP